MKKIESKFVVIRKPNLMEDEGRFFVIGGFDKHEEARDWIREQDGEYFGPNTYFVAMGDYLIAES